MALLVIDALILHALVGFLIYQSFQKEPSLSEDADISEKFQESELSDSASSCNEDCQNYINDRVIRALAENATITDSQTTPTTAQTKTKITRINYVPISGNGSTLQTSWSDLSGTDFYFDKSEFVGFVDAVLEANVKLLNGNGEAFVRIYDVTHGVAVSGSEVKTASQTSVLLTSGKLQFYSGRNLYRIQARSLTADTTVFESGRLKVTTLE